MIFNSITFAVFLPIVFIIYWMIDYWTKTNKKGLDYQNIFIIAASYIFYGWIHPVFTLLLFFTSLCSWFCGKQIDAHTERRKTYLHINLFVNLSILAIFKYYNFFISEVGFLFGINVSNITLNVILPVGISFYTFQAIGYTIDVYRNKITAIKKPVPFFAFLSFFPQLVAGPIERANNLLPQFCKRRIFDFEKASDGIREILWGLFKKIAIADTCALYVDDVFSTYQIYGGSTLLLAACLFSLQIYCDFSGYSDIAIGTAKLFGINLNKNFNYPYFAQNIADFWRRWHISLTSWFRDYIYIPLGGSQDGKSKTILNTLIVFAISGLWHGANWTFVIWGIYNAILFIPGIIIGKRFRHPILTLIFIIFGWIIFRINSAADIMPFFKIIFSDSLFTVPYIISPRYFLPIPILTIILFASEYLCKSHSYGSIISAKPLIVRWGLYLMLISITFLFAGTSTQFIYFQF